MDFDVTHDELIELYELGVSCEGWYPMARDNVAKFADSVGYSADYVAGVVAVLSPRVHVSRNARIAESYLREGTLDGVVSASRAALSHYDQTGEIRGPKTGPFARAINPDHPDPDNCVVVDTWIWRIFYPGVGFSEANVSTRNAIIEAITELAREIGETPANFQARLWGGIRTKWGIVADGANLEFSEVES